MSRSILFAAALAASIALPRPGSAIPTDPENPPNVPCLDGWYGTLTASAHLVAHDQPVTLTWKTENAVSGCPAPTTHLLVTQRGGQVVSTEYVNGSKGSSTKRITGNTQFTLKSVWAPLVTRVTGATWVAARLQDPEPGRPYFQILHGGQRDVFLQAIATANATVVLGDDLDLDLSGLDELFIAPGVQIIGRRSPTNPGPRLYTRSRPARLLNIGDRLVEGAEGRRPADNVRIVGIRLFGGELGIADSDRPPPRGSTSSRASTWRSPTASSTAGASPSTCTTSSTG